MHKVKISYIVQLSIIILVYGLLAVFFSVKVASADQFSVATKIIIFGFLWAVPVYWAFMFVRNYKKLDEYDLDSNDEAPWSTGSGQLNRPQSTLKNIFWGVIVLTVALYASWIVVACVKGVFKATAAKDWPTTMGVVVLSEAVQDCSKSYNLKILYQYKVGTTSYVGNRLTFGLVECGTKSEAQAIASQYPVKSAVTVHFNSELPSEAVIMADQVSNGTWWFIFTMPFAIIVLIFVSWSFLRSVRFS